MNARAARLALVPWFVFFAACSGDRVREDVGIVEEALTTNDRILGFEGSIGGAAGSDWRPVVGTATSSTTHSEGTRSISLGSNWNPSAISAPLTALGALSGPPSVDVLLPAGYQPQVSYYGQVALYVTCGTNIVNQYLGPVALNGPTGVFSHYTFPSLPANIATALSTTNGCTIKVELNLSNAGTLSVLVDRLSVGQAAGSSGGTGGAGGSAGAAGKAGASGSGGSGAAGKAGSGGAGAAGAGAGGKSGGGAGGAGTGTGGAGAGGKSGASGAGGVGGAGTNNGGTAGTSGMGGAGAGGKAGGAGAGGVAGNGGASGAGAGAAGSSGSGGGTSINFFIDLPVHVARQSVALGASGGALVLSDGVRILATPSGFSSVSSVKTTAETNLGVSTEALNLWSEANVVALRSNATLDGNLITEGVVNPQTNVRVLGTETQGATLTPIQHLSWSVPFPASNGGPVNLEPSQVRTIFPGAYAGSTVKSGARLTLDGSGRYTLDGTFDLEPSSILDVDNTQGPVQIYASGGFIFRGAISPRDPTKNNILIGIAGTGAIPIDSSFSGILVASYGDVTLGTVTAGHFGAVYARSINVAAHTDFHHRSFAPSDVCPVGAACDGLCQCDPGGACDDPGDCATDLCCAAGECGGPSCSCSSAAQCAPGLDCSGGTCQSHCALNPHAPECIPATCSDGVKDGNETDVDCGGACPGCTTDHRCNTASDCGSGLVCGSHNGACFDKTREDSVCWPAQCANGVDPSECGSANSPCGQNCSCAQGCDAQATTNTCASGEACVKGLGPEFKLGTRDVCLSSACPSDDPAYCGDPSKLCGTDCICTPDCSKATCQNPDDGCGHLCPGVCAPNTGPCTEDIECADGSACPPAIADGPRVCTSCMFEVLRPPLCGHSGAQCGDTCPACTPRCDGRQCGTDPDCGTSCGTCAEGSFCDANGQCATSSSNPPVTTPNGTPVTDLPGTPAAPVGAIPATFSVSPRGGADYSVPIVVPPGRAGIEPAIALHYVGAHVEGEAGTGWRIEGLSSISRCPHIQALDGYAAPIKNDTSDFFCLDGQRLVRTPGTSGDDGAVYRTAVDTFSKVTSKKDSSSQRIKPDAVRGVTVVASDEQGPDFFEVRTKDGKILEFGHTWDSLVQAPTGVRYSWLLNRVSDRSGNTMTIEYTNVSNALTQRFGGSIPISAHPSRIAYTGHNDTAGNREVRFSYEQRSDGAFRFMQGGIAWLFGDRLNQITTYIDNKPVKNYFLYYPSGGPTQLNELFECDDTGARCKPPTKFTYTVEESSHFGFSNYQFFDLTSVAQLDANGDGIADFLETSLTVDGVPANPMLEAVQNATDLSGQLGIAALSATGIATGGVGFAISALWEFAGAVFFDAFAKSPTVHENDTFLEGTGFKNYDVDGKAPINGLTATGLPCPAGSPMYLLDFNRDGRDDVAGLCGGQDGTGLSLSLWQHDGQFARYPDNQTDVAQAPKTQWASGWRPDPIVFDIDGDGLQDMVSCKDPWTLELRLRIPKTPGQVPDDGQFFSDPIQITTQPNIDPPQTLCGTKGTPVYNVFDLDGDGTQDLFVRDDNQGIWFTLRYSVDDTGAHLAWVRAPFDDTETSSDGQGLTLADFNGDGLADIFRFDGNNKITIWTNTGNGGFVARTLDHPVPPPSNYHYTYRTSAVLDINGDGRDDLVESWEANSANFYNYALIPNSDVSGFTVVELPEIQKQIGNDDPTATATATFNAAADLDGDGAADLFGPDGVFYGHAAKTNLLASAEDGLGNFVSIRYDEAGTYDGTCENTTSTWPETCLRHATGLVSSYSTGVDDEGSAKTTERTYSYAYRNARMNVTGHGWLGFDQVQVRESFPTGLVAGAATTDRITTTVFEPPARYSIANGQALSADDADPGYVYPLAGLPKTVTIDQLVSESAATLLEEASHTRRMSIENGWEVELSKLGSPFPKLGSRTTTRFDPTSMDAEDGQALWSCGESFSVDAYGNERDHTSECPFETVETTTVYTPTDDQWIISNPELVTVNSSSFFGSSQTQTWDPGYDDLGRLTSVTRSPNDSGGEFHSITYVRDDFGNPYQVIESVHSGEGDRTTAVGYDADNIYPFTITNPVGQITQVHFDERWGALTTVSDPNGVIEQRSYDGLGLLSEIDDPTGTTLYSYEGDDGAVTTSAGVIHPRIRARADHQGTEGTRTGSEIQETDYLGRTVRVQSEGLGGASVLREEAFDGRGRRIGSTLPHEENSSQSAARTYEYDDLGRLTALHNADGTTQAHYYASTATLIDHYQPWLYRECVPDNGCPDVDVDMTMDESGLKNVLVRDYRGAIIRNFDGNNVETAALYSSYFYDSLGQLETVRENGASGRSISSPVTYLIHDGYGRLLEHDDPDTGPAKNAYNGFDELLTATDPGLRMRSYMHDNLGRVTSITDDQGDTTFTYDTGANAIGRLTSMTSPPTGANPAGQRIDYFYEPTTTPNRGLLQRADYVIDGNTYSVGYSYDDLGRTSTITYPDLGNGPQVVAKYQYDTSGVLVNLSELQGNSTNQLWQVNNAFEGYLVQDETFGNNAHTTYTYDPKRHFLKSLSTTQGTTPQDTATIQNLSYERYPNGQVYSRTTNESAVGYVYDALGRLSFVNDLKNVAVHTPYIYDDFGNLTQKGDHSVTYDYRSGRPHLIATVGANGYEYDGSGNVSHRSGPDVPGNDQTITYTPFNLPSQITTGAKVSQFEYTADEERLVRRDPDSVRYFVSDLYQRLARPDGVTTSEERFRLFAGGRLIGEIVRTPGGSDKTQFFHMDDLDTVDTISSATSADAVHQDFDVFGMQLDSSMPALTRAGFTGQDHDADLGLIDMHGRIYDPLAGRFMSQDPIMQAPFSSQGANRYSYVFNDPTNITDPSGFAASDICTLLGACYPNVAPSRAFGGDVSSDLGASAASGPAGLLTGATDVGIRAVMGNPFGAKPGYTVSGTASIHHTGGSGRAQSAEQGARAAGGDHLGAIPCPKDGCPSVWDLGFQFAPGAGVVIEEGEVGGRLLFNLFRSLFKTPTIAELVLKPAGKLIGSAGKSAGVRFLEGGLPAAQKLMGRLLSRGATRLTPVGSVAEKFALKEGGTVALRTVSSTPGVVATIDIDVADVEIHEIKFVAGAVP
jgi:RHS repeat-associated protein